MRMTSARKCLISNDEKRQKKTSKSQNSLHYSDNCFENKTSLYIASNYKRYRTDEFSVGV